MAVTKLKGKQKAKRVQDFDASVLSTSRSYIALAYGVLTVLVLFFLVFAAIKFISHNPTTSIGEDGISTKVETSSAYIVKEGDTLWSIAEKNYADGYSWTEIAKINNIKNPGEIEKGQKIVIPTISASRGEASMSPTPTQGTSPEATTDKIMGSYYTVKEGDSLWTIAVRAYGDGYKWVDIANRNSLTNPDVIHPGNQFVLPR